MNYWLEQRKKTISYTLEICSSQSNLIIYSESYVDQIVFHGNQQYLIVKLDYDRFLENLIKDCMLKRSASNHIADVRIYRKGSLREEWSLPGLTYMKYYRPWGSQKMFFTIGSPIIWSINSKYL